MQVIQNRSRKLSSLSLISLNAIKISRLSPALLAAVTFASGISQNASASASQGIVSQPMSHSTISPVSTRKLNCSLSFQVNPKPSRIEAHWTANGPLYKVTSEDSLRARFYRPVVTAALQNSKTKTHSHSSELPISARLMIPQLHAEPAHRRQGMAQLATLRVRTESGDTVEHYIENATTVAESPIRGVFLVGTSSGAIYIASADPDIRPIELDAYGSTAIGQPQQTDGLIFPHFTEESSLRTLSYLKFVDESSIQRILNQNYARDGAVVHLRFLPREIQGRRPLLEIGRRNFRNYASTPGFHIERQDLSQSQWAQIAGSQPARFRPVKQIASAAPRKRTDTITNLNQFGTWSAPPPRRLLQRHLNI